MSTLQKLDTHPLAICFRILQALGQAGEYVWECHKTTERLELSKAERELKLTPELVDELRAVRISRMKESIAWLRKKASERHYWSSLPVDFMTFVESDKLLKKRGVLWPGVLREGAEINSGKYVETVLTGGIGVAKTTIAIYSQAYQLYVLSCMLAAHRVFDLDPASEILIVFQSVNKHLAMDVDYTRFRNMLLESPYFTEVFPFDKSHTSKMSFPKNFVVKPVSGTDTAAIGQNVIGGIIDEVNFMAVTENSKVSKDGGLYDQAVSNYNSIARRRESRFMQLGELPGMLCLVSSRNYPGQFTDKKEEEARTNPRIYVYSKRIWDLRPERFCGDKFKVFVGDDTRKPRILEEGEVVPQDDQHLCMAIPMEYRSRFENDLLAMLRDVAGVATQALHPFIINTDLVALCFGKVKSVLSREDVDFVSTRLAIYPERFEHRDQVRFAHVDLAISKDSAGVTVGHVCGFKDVDRGEYKETLPIIQIDFVLEVRPPRGGEIEFGKIRELLYAIRKVVPFKWVSFDQFQSKDSMQIMHQNGYSVGYQSIDTDTTAYDVLKQALYDGRVMLPAHPKVHKELVTLEIDQKKGKVDHPPNGSKDVADSLAGVVYGLTMRREIWQAFGVPLNKVPKTVTEAKIVSKKSLSYMEKVRDERGVAHVNPESLYADL